MDEKERWIVNDLLQSIEKESDDLHKQALQIRKQVNKLKAVIFSEEQTQKKLHPKSPKSLNITAGDADLIRQDIEKGKKL